DPEMYAIGHRQARSRTGDDGGVSLQRQGKAKDLDSPAFRKRQSDLTDAPCDCEQRDIMVMLREQRGSGERQRRRAVTIDDGVDLFRSREVADRDHVVSDLRYADGAVFRWNAVDCVTGV